MAVAALQDIDAVGEQVEELHERREADQQQRELGEEDAQDIAAESAHSAGFALRRTKRRPSHSMLLLMPSKRCASGSWPGLWSASQNSHRLAAPNSRQGTQSAGKGPSISR